MFQIDAGDLSAKPGWIRLSIHPTLKDDEIFYITHSIRDIVRNIIQWEKDYQYNYHTNEFYHIRSGANGMAQVKKWFEL